MAAVMLPIFPLGQVLMPGRPLPLRIFEPRYVRQLLQRRRRGVRACGRFGVVALTAGYRGPGR